MHNELKLVRTRRINGCLLEYYMDNQHEIWITREQIGSFLGYASPNNAIALMHSRHLDRLDLFSSRISVPCSDSEDAKKKEVIAYSFKGLLEICRWSRQPNADLILDCLFDFFSELDEIEKNVKS